MRWKIYALEVMYSIQQVWSVNLIIWLRLLLVQRLSAQKVNVRCFFVVVCVVDINTIVFSVAARKVKPAKQMKQGVPQPAPSSQEWYIILYQSAIHNV